MIEIRNCPNEPSSVCVDRYYEVDGTFTHEISDLRVCADANASRLNSVGEEIIERHKYFGVNNPRQVEKIRQAFLAAGERAKSSIPRERLVCKGRMSALGNCTMKATLTERPVSF